MDDEIILELLTQLTKKNSLEWGNAGDRKKLYVSSKQTLEEIKVEIDKMNQAGNYANGRVV